MEINPREIFDAAGLVERLGGRADLAKRVVAVFLGDAPKQLSHLAAAVAAGDCSAAAVLAHSLKGAAASVGAPAFQEIAREMETLARAGERAQLPSLLVELDSRLAELQETLEEWFLAAKDE